MWFFKVANQQKVGELDGTSCYGALDRARERSGFGKELVWEFQNREPIRASGKTWLVMRKYPTVFQQDHV